jgi:hypothetical protein
MCLLIHISDAVWLALFVIVDFRLIITLTTSDETDRDWDKDHSGNRYEHPKNVVHEYIIIFI